MKKKREDSITSVTDLAPGFFLSLFMLFWVLGEKESAMFFLMGSGATSLWIVASKGVYLCNHN